MHDVGGVEGVQYVVEFQMVPFDALSLWCKGRGTFGGESVSFESTEVVWWQVMQVTAEVLMVEYVASGRRYFTGCTSFAVFR
jgi:hypothetical protein